MRIISRWSKIATFIFLMVCTSYMSYVYYELTNINAILNTLVDIAVTNYINLQK